MSDFLPIGRTSLIKANGVDLQVQTEYAFRPYPRITSTILREGKVLHKLEKKLNEPVACPESQEKAEHYIKRQHAVILDTIQDQPGSLVEKQADEVEQNEIARSVGSAPAPTVSKNNFPHDERILAVPGTQEIYHLDMLGNFLEPGYDEKFRNSHPSVYKNLRDFLDIFPVGASGIREKGVYEVERDRLYLISVGDECYFAAVRRNDGETRYEKAYKVAIAGPEDLMSTI